LKETTCLDWPLRSFSLKEVKRAILGEVRVAPTSETLSVIERIEREFARLNARIGKIFPDLYGKIFPYEPREYQSYNTLDRKRCTKTPGILTKDWQEFFLLREEESRLDAAGDNVPMDARPRAGGV
jgi:hypothetical protein